MDECLPPIIRDSRWFMYPFFYVWFKGKNLKLYMDFKSLVYKMTPLEYANAYRELDSRATDRPTDMNEPTIRTMLEKLDPTTTSLLDVGCGRGYLLSRVAQHNPKIALTGCDVYDNVEIPGTSYKQGVITNLPFADGAFDVVTATCILEHIVDLEKAVAELKRVARKQVIIVVPCQRYYYYTLDMHVHFFPIASDVEHMMNMPSHTCEKIRGDWLFVGEKK
jgi:ubiquinone/menaquinone biosynthesis C-methylase UbiE